MAFLSTFLLHSGEMASLCSQILLGLLHWDSASLNRSVDTHCRLLVTGLDKMAPGRGEGEYEQQMQNRSNLSQSQVPELLRGKGDYFGEIVWKHG